MKVLKFGGTSVGTAERIRNVAELISDGSQHIVVLSAMSGTTNSLLQAADYVRLGNPEAAADLINQLEAKYVGVCRDLDIEYILKGFFSELRKLCLTSYSIMVEKEIVSYGEILSTNMMTAYLLHQGKDAVLMPALDYMRIDDEGEPDMLLISNLLSEQMRRYGGHKLVITQGFICRNPEGRIDNLKRGGSDYTASIIGGLLEVEEIQIWTDIDGMHNNDPRIVEGTKPVPQLSFSEAAELAYFGAKILHPTCILPAKMHNVPVRLKNTMEPTAPGTLINNEFQKGRIEAVAAKDGITAIRVHSDRMLMAYGFLSRVFGVFEHYKTAIDLITTSEVAVSMTVDNVSHISEIVEELKKLGTVSVKSDLTIISVVGDLRSENLGFEAKVVNALADVPVLMISYGGNNHNISILVNSADKNRALRQLSQHLF